jgi:molybdenum cofactor biosynthesis protein MoaC
MRDIAHKQITLRTAKAVGIIFCSPQTILKIENDSLPKGNLFDVARAAGFIGAKATPQLLPHCHPVMIDGMDMQFEFLQQAKHGELFRQTFSHGAGL